MKTLTLDNSRILTVTDYKIDVIIDNNRQWIVEVTTPNIPTNINLVEVPDIPTNIILTEI